MNKKCNLQSNLDNTSFPSKSKPPKQPSIEVLIGDLPKSSQRKQRINKSASAKSKPKTDVHAHCAELTLGLLGGDTNSNVGAGTLHHHSDHGVNTDYIQCGFISPNLDIFDDDAMDVEECNIQYNDAETHLLNIDPLSYHEEIDMAQYITPLQDAITAAQLADYKCNEADLVYHQLLLESAGVIFAIQNSILLFSNYNQTNKSLKKQDLLICEKRGSSWICDKHCHSYNAKKYSNEANDNSIALCIHGVLSHLIVEHSNPTNLGIKEITNRDRYSGEHEIYFISHFDKGQKEYIFLMKQLKVSRLLWINRSGVVKCSTHAKWAKGCHHTHLLNTVLKETMGERDYSIVTGQGKYERIMECGQQSFNSSLIYSKEQIPVPLTLLTQFDSWQSTKSREYYKYIQSSNPPSELTPESETCNICNTSSNDMERKMKTAKYLDVHIGSEVPVYYDICTCGEVYHLDGLMKHLYNYNDSVIWTHELLIDILQYMTSSEKKTFTGYFNDLFDRYLIRGVSIKVDKALLISVWLHFFRSVEFDKKLGCRLCDPSGKNIYYVLIFDGTDIILKRHYVKDCLTPTQTNSLHDLTVKMKYLSSTRFIKNVKDRKLLERHIISEFGAKAIDGQIQDLNSSEIEKLNKYLNETEHKDLKIIIEWAKNLKTDNKNEELVRLLYPILRHCFKSVDITQVAHPLIIDKLLDFENVNWVLDETVFAENSIRLRTVINKLIEMHGCFGNIPTEFVMLMKSIGLRADELRKENLSNRYKQSNPRLEDAVATEAHKKRFSSFTTSGSDFSGELLRNRLNYTIDGKRNYRNDTKCSKNYPKKADMTSSFMICWCPHRVGVWCSICETGESVDEVISGTTCTLYIAPKYVIYDNPCAVSVSARLKEWEYWSRTVFLGDETHMKGHKCGGCYNIYPYKHSDIQLIAQMNDSAAEQGNAILTTIKKAATYMSLETLMVMIRASLEVDKRKVYQKYGYGVRNVFESDQNNEPDHEMNIDTT